ncbi:Asp23/Gls24 family envelope stress response protein [Paenalkalicoccus suaedae]|uniref:Alkaline shock protein 23 n=1 Tax=Paenalkalicoccus suaedae TaxID=2592382 RepID=A0A859FAT4_9BACI|nr:Asp23/Gls24 family envelope stress response protein [Paenalkalicoccus suaedae]QKS70050.1 Asp23/Gls24 family envelope stress response protein [Paenalkalicoccus suaedae]
MAQQNVRSTEKTPEQLQQEERRNQEPERRDKLTFDDDVIRKITALAINETNGILGMSGSVFEGLRESFGADEKITKGISAAVGEKQVALDIDVIIEYGQKIPDVYKSAKENVESNITHMTGLEVVEFNMHVSDILTREDFESRNSSSSNTRRDRVE